MCPPCVRGARIATHARAHLVLRFRFPLLVYRLQAPARAAARCRGRAEAGALRRAARSLRAEGPRRDRRETALDLSLVHLVGAEPRHPVPLSRLASVQSAAPPAADDR